MLLFALFLCFVGSFFLFFFSCSVYCVPFFRYFLSTHFHGTQCFHSSLSSRACHLLFFLSFAFVIYIFRFSVKLCHPCRYSFKPHYPFTLFFSSFSSSLANHLPLFITFFSFPLFPRLISSAVPSYPIQPSPPLPSFSTSCLSSSKLPPFPFLWPASRFIFLES